MKNILHELWKGELSPLEEFGAGTKEYHEKHRLLIQAEKALNQYLDEKGKLLFDAFDQCHAELDRVSEPLIFAKGFCLAVQLLLAALSEN